MNAVIPVSEREFFSFPSDYFEEFKVQAPQWTVEGYLTYLRTYSATIGDETGKTRNEQWWETCRRVVEGTMSILRWHRKQVQRADIGSREYQKLEQFWADNLYRTLFFQKWSPAGRGLQHMGRRDVIWEKGAAVLNNCAFISTAHIDRDFTEPFEYLMDMSMLGVGTGFDVEGRGRVSLAPPRIDSSWSYRVRDTREGWVALLKVVLLALRFPASHSLPHTIDYGQIRPEGTPLVTMGGLASGPGPLQMMVLELLSVVGADVTSTVDEQTPTVLRYHYVRTPTLEPRPITANQIGDLMNIIGKCVISGGIRRTAEIGLAPIEEWEFFERKQDGELLKRYRSFSNNSIVTDRDLTLEECQKVGSQAAQFGDPGIFFRHNARAWGRTKQPDLWDFVMGCNPCGEQQLLDGEMCNLVETVPWRHDSSADYLNTCRCAFLYAKIVSLLPTHRPKVNRIQIQNRRVGVSATGVFMAYEKFGREVYLKEYAVPGWEEIRAFDADISAWLGVRFSVRRTSVKPSGSVSLVLGVTPGIRAPEGPFSLKLIQFEQTSPLLPLLRDAGYRIEKSIYTPSSYVVYFPVAALDCKRGVDDVSAAEQIQMVIDMQTYWADNMVSNTIEYHPSEIPALGQLIFQAQEHVKSLAFMARVHGFEQAPFQRISEEQYRQEIERLTPIDFSQLHGTVVHEIDERGCDNGSCAFVPNQE